MQDDDKTLPSRRNAARQAEIINKQSARSQTRKIDHSPSQLKINDFPNNLYDIAIWMEFQWPWTCITAGNVKNDGLTQTVHFHLSLKCPCLYSSIQQNQMRKLPNMSSSFFFLGFNRINQQFSTKLNCKLVSQEICAFTKEKIERLGIAPKITVILALSSEGKPDPASSIYVSKKLELMPKLSIKSELIHVSPSTSKQQMAQIIDRLNKDTQNTSTMVQLPFPEEFSFDINELINSIDNYKNIDGFSFTDTNEPNFNNPKTLKPPTPLGILTLLGYYGIKTEGKNVAIIGKGSLVGFPLIKILQGYPYYATVTCCDIFTENIKEITSKADIIISACGSAQVITAADIKENAILIDAGINEVVNDDFMDRLSILPATPTFVPDASPPKKRRIIGDICRSAYHRTKFYTPVPGGVGLLTVASLAFNVLNSYLLQKNMPTFNLQRELYLKDPLNHFVAQQNSKTKQTRIMLLSSAYNGLTQKIDKTLVGLGYGTFFQTASSEEAMREGVKAFKPDLIICPTLMKAIPEDIYKNIKCLIVHPGIKGDRGPSSIDWAILNKEKEWGVTLLEADKEMDAGDIWASRNFPIREGQSKVEIYNSEVSKTAQSLVLEAINKFEAGGFLPEKLNYNNPQIKGRLHRTIRFADKERTVDWESQSTEEILLKAKAADTQPGLKVQLFLGDKALNRFTYGYVRERNIVPPSSAKNGEIFLQKYEAVCVKTKDGAVWIQQMRNPKSASQPHPFKVPSTIQLGADLLANVQRANAACFQASDEGTFQEVTFERRGKVGVVGFDFYNGAMSTLHCERMAKAVAEIGAVKGVDVLVFKGSERNWSNGIHLNVIEHSGNAQEEAWQNIVAINKIVKAMYRISDKMTVSAVQANAGAGGVYLALATDYCFARDGVVLNPHYKNMGLYGSELHTATAALKFGNSILGYLKDSAKPLLVQEAASLRLLDPLETEGGDFLERVLQFGEELAADRKRLKGELTKRNEKRKMLFKFKPLEDYEAEELGEMKADIFADRHSFSAKRTAFVKKL